MNISQSLLKELIKYRLGDACGKKIKAYYIDKTHQMKKDAFDKGKRFEYLVTGKGDGAEPLLTPKTGKVSAAENDAAAAAEKVLAFLNDPENDIGIMDTDVRFDVPLPNGGTATGIIDIIANRDGIKTIIDLKYSGLLGNKWSEYGWHPDTLSTHHFLQPTHYITYGAPDAVEFWYLVQSSTDATKFEVFPVRVTPEAKERHKDMVSEFHDFLELEYLIGFQPTPEYRFCNDCEVDCPLRVKYHIHPQTVI